ncbi:MAG: hypothetical protein RIK87_00655 [Fuerstiella sp.]
MYLHSPWHYDGVVPPIFSIIEILTPVRRTTRFGSRRFLKNGESHDELVSVILALLRGV